MEKAKAQVNSQHTYDQFLLWHEGYKNVRFNGHITGYQFKLRIPQYQGTYLSAIDSLKCFIDGEPISEADAVFRINGKYFNLGVIKELYSEFWDVLDCAVIEVYKEGGLTGKHEFEVHMDLRFPYADYFGVCKVVHAECIREFDFQDK